MKLLGLLSVLFLFIPVDGHANNPVGNVLIAKGVVTATIKGSGLRTLSKGSDVFLGETIATASDSFVVLRMSDKSKISLRPKSEVTLEEFSKKPGKEAAIFDLIKGGLRAISGDIGKKRPDQFRVETSIATVGIRGTDFIVRLCEDHDCKDEEQSFGEMAQQATGPAGGGNNNRKKKLKKLDNNNAVTQSSFIECPPAAEIKRGLYVAVLDGVIFVRTGDEEVELEAVEALFAQDRKIVCLGTLPNFISQDSYLSEDPEGNFTLFNILKNINEERQRCTIPEA